MRRRKYFIAKHYNRLFVYCTVTCILLVLIIRTRKDHVV